MASHESDGDLEAEGNPDAESSRRDCPPSQSQVDSPASTDARAPLQGSILSIRDSMQQVLDSWWTSRACRREMEEALHQLSCLESSFLHLKRQSVNSEEKSSLEELREELQVGKTKSVSHSRRWLVETFIEANPESNLPHSRRSSVSEAAVSAISAQLSSSKPDEDISLSIEPVLANLETQASDLLEKAGSLDFDAAACADVPGMKGHLLQVLFKSAVKQENVLEKVEQQGNLLSEADFNKSLFAFLGKVEEMYSPLLQYHTAIHAADVMMTMEWFLRAPALAAQVSDLDHLMVLISCAIHDVEHPGRNNLFHTKTMSPLAVTYNDKSVLENMHVASAFQVMIKDARYNWLAQLKNDFLPEGGLKAVNLQHYVRRGVIDLVLGTDMTKHNQHQKGLNNRLAARDNCNTEAVGESLELLEAIVHAADISNPCKPKPMMLYWTQRVVEEFWAQGDEEIRLNIEVSPMCDRAVGEDSIPKQQLGFIDFIIAPYYTPLAELLPEVEEATKNMAENRSFWVAKEKEQVHYSHLFKESVAV